MKTKTILLIASLAIKSIYSKAIDNITDVVANQLNVEDNSIEIVEINNFINKLHCSYEKELCNKIKDSFDFAFDKISNAFGKYFIFFYKISTIYIIY